MREPSPILVHELFQPERAHLLALLNELSPAEWSTPTICPGWSVKDIALHLLGNDFSILSRKRDHFDVSAGRINGWDELVRYLNALNQQWVDASRRLSTRLLCDLLAMSGPWIDDYLASIDLFAVGSGVGWAGPDPAPVWLDVAREYTERWVHQQQIRDAVGVPGLTDPRFGGPVIAAFAHALPHTYRDIDAADGTVVTMHITGAAGGHWSIVREPGRWVLKVGAPTTPDAILKLGFDTAWRRFTRGMSGVEARRQATISGDEQLAAPALDALAIIA